MENVSILACKHKFSFTPKGIAFYLIRKLAGPYDHVALLIDVAGVWMVQEATMKHGIVRLKLNDWVNSEARAGLDEFTVIPTNKRPPLWRLNMYLGIKYDYASYLSHIYYLIKNKWVGQLPGKGAECRYTCSEWIAKVLNVPSWWRQTPSSLVKYYERGK